PPLVFDPLSLHDALPIWSLPGAIFLLGFVLYPYVYLSTRVMFATQAASLLEAARILGASGRSTFFRVALPMARPAIAVGVSLARSEEHTSELQSREKLVC